MSSELGDLLDDLVQKRISRRRFITKAAALGLSIGAIGAIVSACGGGATATPAATESATAAANTTATVAAATGGKPAAQQQLIIACAEDTATYDPGINWDYGAMPVTPIVYEGLMAWRGATESILEPNLAASYEASQDGLTYTFKLKDGIKFSDGSPLTAEDVKFSFERVLKINQGPAVIFEPIGSIDAPDPRTVVIHLKHVFSLFPATLASPWGPLIVNPRVVKANENNGDLAQDYLRNHAAGSGPFVMDQWDQERKQVSLSRNKDWWQGWDDKPHLDKVIFRYGIEASQQRMLLERGEVDIAIGLAFEDYDALRQQSGMVVQEFLGPRMQRMQYNLTKKPLDDVKVRQALNHAFNCDQAINGVLNGHGSKMESVVQKGVLGWAPAATQYNFDLDKSKALLAEAGLANGFDLGEMVWQTGFDFERASLEMYQGDLEKLGIKSSIREIPTATYFDLTADAKTTPEVMLVGGLGPDYSDAFEMINVAYGSANVPFDNTGRYKNDKVDELLGRAQETMDEKERFPIYKQIIDLVSADAVCGWCIQANEQIAMHNYAQGYDYTFILSKQFFPLHKMWKSEA